MHRRNLFLIDGAAGTGKSDLLEYIAQRYAPSQQARVVTKFTTRAKRPEETTRAAKLDLEFVSERQFRDRLRRLDCYVYEYGGHRYGINRATLDAALASCNNVFLIVRDSVTIQRIRAEYDHAHVVVVYVYSDRDQIVARLSADGYDSDAIRFRLDRQQLVWNDYLRHPRLYDEVLLNNSVRNDLHRLLDALVESYATVDKDAILVEPGQEVRLPSALVGFREEIQRRLDWHPYARNVFVMMKYRPGNQVVWDFIREEIASRGYNPIRADDTEWNITDNVYNPIAVLHCCKFGIALFDEAEPGSSYSANVAYELGMMHLQRKPCLILRHSSLEPLPFDLVKDLYRPYTRDLELRAHVNNWLHALPSATLRAE